MFKISKFDFYTFTMSYLYRAFASPGSIYVNFMKTVINTGLKYSTASCLYTSYIYF